MGPRAAGAGAGGGVRRSVSDRLLGYAGGAMIVAALMLLIFGGPGDQGSTLILPPPSLELISPVDRATTDNPLQLIFRTGDPITPQPGGWGRGGYHIHGELNGREVMPGPADIRRQRDGSYLWALGRVPAGEVRLRLYWSDAAHRPVESAATEPISVRVD
jgi:hypothetical protein